MKLEDIILKHKKIINYEISNILGDNFFLWDEAFQDTIRRIYKFKDSIPAGDDNDKKRYIRIIARNAARDVLI